MNIDKRQSFIRGLFLKNPVLVRAIGLGPIAAAALTLKMGLALSVIMTVLLFGSGIFGYFLISRFPKWLKAPAHIVLSAALLIPAYLIVDLFFPMTVYSLSVFAPLMVVNSILSSYSGGNYPYISVMMSDTAGNAIGFAAVALIFSAAREYLTAGTIWDANINHLFEIPALKLPFAGFIMLGLSAAVFKKIRIKYAAKISLNSGGDNI